MKKSEIFDTITRKVAEICEVDFKDLTSGVTGRDVVDARILCVQFLWRIGFSNEEYAYLAGAIAQKMFKIARQFMCDCCRKKR